MAFSGIDLMTMLCLYLFWFFIILHQGRERHCAFEENDDLRVEGTSLKNVGHLEICHNGTWGVICGDNWGETEAQVACRQLGFSSGRALTAEILKSWSAHGRGNYSKGSVPRIGWLDHVYCKGNESRLIDCRLGMKGRPLTDSYLLDLPSNKMCFNETRLAGVECFSK